MSTRLKEVTRREALVSIRSCEDFLYCYSPDSKSLRYVFENMSTDSIVKAYLYTLGYVYVGGRS